MVLMSVFIRRARTLLSEECETIIQTGEKSKANCKRDREFNHGFRLRRNTRMDSGKEKPGLSRLNKKDDPCLWIGVCPIQRNATGRNKAGM